MKRGQKEVKQANEQAHGIPSICYDLLKLYHSFINT